MAVVKKFGDDQGGNLAALISYYAFFSLFPLLLVFTTILGFVLSGNPSAQQSIVHSALGQLPIISSSIKTHSLSGNVLALVLGQARLLGLQPARVVALVGDPPPAVELEDPAGDVVEEVAIVGDRDDRALVILKMALEPRHRLGVEVVGRLVQQQQVGL